MAIDFHLDLAAPSTARTVADAVLAAAVPHGVLPADTTVEALLGDGVTLRSGAWCRATEPRRTQPWPTPLEDDFGIARTCWLAFRLTPSDGSVAWQQDEMVWLTSALLARLPGDAALHFEYEVVWLVRKGGRLVVSDRDDVWTPGRLAMLPEPYERAPLAFAGG